MTRPAGVLGAALACVLLVPPGAQAAPGDGVRRLDLPAAAGHVRGLAYDGQHLWVADHLADQLSALDPQTGEVRRTLPAPDGHVRDLAFGGGKLWVLDAGPERARIHCLDPGSGLIEHRMDSPVRAAAGLAHDGTHLWLLESARRRSQLHRLDPGDGTTIASVPAPSRRGNALAWDGGRLWVADRLADRLYLVAPDNGAVLRSLPAPGPYSSGLAILAEQLAVVDYQADRIDVLVRDDGTLRVRLEPKEEVVELLMTVRNYGPGTVTTADLLIAEPRDLASQELLAPPAYTPAPAEITADRYGQRVARFRLTDVAPGEGRQVTMRVPARLYGVEYYIDPERVQGRAAIPPAVAERYLVDLAKFDLQHPLIQQTVREVVGTETNPYWIVRKLARHIQDELEYELAGGWNVAPRVLARGTGSCSEYTFVFLALCRAAGVPARYAGALVIRGDDASTDEVFHRWAEVYLPPYGWVPYDVQHGDKPTEAERAAAFGRLKNTVLVTTHGGGGSELLEWNYNGNVRYTCDGPCRVDVEYFAEWEPQGEREYAPPARLPAPPCECGP